MKKLSMAPYLVAAGIILTLVAADALAQGRVKLYRVLQTQQGVYATGQADAQFNRRNGRLPLRTRRMKGSPLGDPQLGRRPNPNQARKQELRRRLMQAIGLTPQQHQRMQEIRRGHEDTVIATGRRLRQARQALDRAIMSEPYDDALVRQATENLAAAHADKIRLESRIRAQVRGVLTSDQVIRFHQLERQMRREMREQNQQNREQGFNFSKQPAPLVAEDTGLLGLLFFTP
jgi:Spy/CpxP family protein refolding chaperone